MFEDFSVLVVCWSLSSLLSHYLSLAVCLSLRVDAVFVVKVDAAMFVLD